jgi:serine/threonine protein kinase
LSGDDALRLALELPDGRRHPLPADRPLVIGTDPGPDGLRLRAPGVGSRHVALARLKSGGFGLKTIDADAHTRLDGQPVRQARLAPGARLELGTVTLEVVDLDRPPKRESSAPARVGGFLIEREIGRGSIGRVFLAVQESLDRRVALKLLRPELAADGDFVARFQAEARAAAALAHPNIVTVYDVGSADGQHYLALEYMERGSLEDRLASDGPLPWRAVLGILRDAAAGLEFAEQKSLVHRDIKPANLMQSMSGATKLVDLGLATSVAATAETDGKLRGTPHFMSPEQARGAPLDVRSDLFSLGSTAHRLLTGATPFEGEHSKAILRAVVQDPPRPLEVAGDPVPPAFQGLLARLMAKDPAHRPASARAAREEIEALISQLGQGDMPGSQSRSSIARRATAIAVIVVLVGIAISVALLAGDDPPPTDGQSAGDPASADRLAPEAPAGSDPSGAFERGDASAEGSDPSIDWTPSDDGFGERGRAAGTGEERIEALERSAEAALEEARGLSDRQERMAALRAVAEEYLGTDAARLASDEVAVLEDGAETPEAPEPAPAEALIAHLSSTGVDSDGAWLPPQVAFERLLAASPPIGVPADDRFETLRAGVLESFEVGLRVESDARLAVADELVVAGRLDDAAAAYAALLGWLEELPPEAERRLARPADATGQEIGLELQSGQLPTDREGVLALLAEDQAIESAHTWRLTDRIEHVNGRIAALEERWRDRYATSMLQRDRALIASALSDGRFERALIDFDLPAAASILRSLLPELRSAPARDSLDRSARRVSEAHAAFQLLVSAWRDGGWKRTTVVAPSRERVAGAALQVRPDGLVIESDEGPLDLPFASFGADAEALEGLFSNRLDREFTATERTRVADLVALAATVHGIGRVRPVLDPARRARLSEGEASDVAEEFALARETAPTPTPDALLEDQRAWRRLSTALRAVDDQDWATAEFSLGVLLGESPFSILTLLWSDGRPRGDAVTWPPELEAPRAWTPAERPSDPAADEASDPTQR